MKEGEGGIWEKPVVGRLIPISGVSARTPINIRSCGKEPSGKMDSGKDRWDLLPIEQVEYVVKVLTYGATKYEDHGWKKVVSDKPDRYFAAAMRHLSQWRQGKRIDDETCLPHLAHAVCCLLFLMWNDDRK